MAITKEMTRGRPVLMGVEDKKNKFSIPVTFKLLDSGVEIFSIDERVEYTQGQSLVECLTPTGKRIQKAVDAFEAEKALDGKSAVDSAITTLKNNITTTL